MTTAAGYATKLRLFDTIINSIQPEALMETPVFTSACLDQAKASTDRKAQAFTSYAAIAATAEARQELGILQSIEQQLKDHLGIREAKNYTAGLNKLYLNFIYQNSLNNRPEWTRLYEFWCTDLANEYIGDSDIRNLINLYTRSGVPFDHEYLTLQEEVHDDDGNSWSQITTWFRGNDCLIYFENEDDLVAEIQAANFMRGSYLAELRSYI
jgi:hypothetical protein